jgi:hypothetical protein
VHVSVVQQQLGDSLVLSQHACRPRGACRALHDLDDALLLLLTLSDVCRVLPCLLRRA